MIEYSDYTFIIYLNYKLTIEIPGKKENMSIPVIMFFFDRRR